MENRIAKVVFSRTFLHNGLATDDLTDILNELPEDAVLIGLSEDYSNMAVGMVFHSEQFKIVSEGGIVPVITPHFEKHVDEDGVIFGVLDNLDMSEALDPDYEAKIARFDTETTGLSTWTEYKPNFESKISTMKFKSWSELADTKTSISEGIEPFTLPENYWVEYYKLLDASIKADMDRLIYGTGFVKTTENNVEHISPYEIIIPEGFKVDEIKLTTATGLNYVTEVVRVSDLIDKPKLGEWRRAGTTCEMTIGVPECEHDWKRYEGFTQKYNYCTKCDVKKDV